MKCNCIPRCPSEHCTGCCPCCRKAGREQTAKRPLTRKELEIENALLKELLREKTVAPVNHSHVCGKTVTGHFTSTCTLPAGHRQACWFPNMWNDM